MAEYSLHPVSHPPYSPDIAPCDFYLFGDLKQKIKGHELKNERDLRVFLESHLSEITESKILEVFHSWIGKLEAMIAANGEYVS